MDSADAEGVRLEASRTGLLDRLQDNFFGYDYFVSYAWADGWSFVEDLTRHLTASGMRCFVDRRELRKGEDLREGVARGLRRSRVTLAVCTPAARHNPWVHAEVAEARSRGRQVVELRFGKLGGLRLDGAAGAEAGKEPLHLVLEEDGWLAPDAALAAAELVASYRGTRRERLARRWLVGALFAVSAFAVAVLVLALIAENRRRELQVERDTSLSLVVTQRAQASEESPVPTRLLLAREAARITFVPHAFVRDETRQLLIELIDQVGGRTAGSLGTPLELAALLPGEDLAGVGVTEAGELVRWGPGGRSEFLPLEGGGWQTVVPMADSSRCLVASRLGLVTLDGWHVPPTRRQLVAYPHRFEAVPGISLQGLTTLACAADGRLFATGAVDGTVHLWECDPEDPRLSTVPLRSSPGAGQMVRALAFAGDALFIASYSAGLEIWNHRDPAAARTVVIGDGLVAERLATHVGSEGVTYALGADDGTLVVGEWPAGAPRRIGSMPDEVTALAFGPRGEVLLAGDVAGRVGRFTLGEGVLQIEQRVVGAHEGRVLAVGLRGDEVRSIGAEGTWRAWRPWGVGPEDEPIRLRSGSGGALGLHWHPGGHGLWGADSTSGLVCVTPDRRLIRTAWPAPTSSAPSTSAVAAAFGGDWLGWVADDQQVVRARLGADGTLHDVQSLGSTEPASALAISSQGVVACSGARGAVRVFGMADEPLRLEVGGDSTASLAFTAAGRFLVAASRDAPVRAWRIGPAPDGLSALDPIGWEWHQDDGVSTVAACRSGHDLVAVGDAQGRLRVLDLAGSPPVWTEWTHEDESMGAGRILSLTFEDPGRIALADTEDWLMVARRTATGFGLHEFEAGSTILPGCLAMRPGAHAEEWAAAFGSPVGLRLFSADASSEPRPRLRLPLSANSVIQIAWSPDGAQVAALDVAGQIVVWSVDPGRWLEAAASKVGRELTDAERGRYIESALRPPR